MRQMVIPRSLMTWSPQASLHSDDALDHHVFCAPKNPKPSMVWLRADLLMVTSKLALAPAVVTLSVALCADQLPAASRARTRMA